MYLAMFSADGFTVAKASGLQVVVVETVKDRLSRPLWSRSP